MARLEWDAIGERLFESGVDRGVLYPLVSGTYPKGVVWNGITAVNENPSGGEANEIYADNINYLTLRSAEKYGITINAYTYPDEFAECDGTAAIGQGITVGQQKRKPFGLSYRTLIGNDVDGESHGYKIHLAYGCTVSPSARDHQTINESPEALEMSWEGTCTPVNVGEGFKPTSTLEIDSTKVSKELLDAVENILYGSETEEARLPLPSEIMELATAEKN